MESKVIILNGSGGVGKDTFVNCVEQFINTFHYSSVSEIKNLASMMGWDGGKTERDRKFLSDLKILSSHYNDLPFNSIKSTINRFLMCYPKDSLLFIDIREPKEIERAVVHFKAKTILIKNINVKEITSNMADANVLNYDYDYVIENNGNYNDLKVKAQEIVDLYKRGIL